MVSTEVVHHVFTRKICSFEVSSSRACSVRHSQCLRASRTDFQLTSSVPCWSCELDVGGCRFLSVLGGMSSLSSSNLPQNHNTSPPSSAHDPALSDDPSCVITIDDPDSAIERLELESLKRKCKKLEDALQARREEEDRELTCEEKAEVKRAIDATEFAERVKERTITISHSSGESEPVVTTELPHSYQQIKNLLWINSQPIYRTALADWRCKVSCFEARVERKTKLCADLSNEVYNLIGFYSFFQGMLLTSTIQSNYLHCQNFWFVFFLSALASVGSLLAINQKYKRITELEKNICSEEKSLKEVRKRISSLETNGEAFRFHDFLEDKEPSSHCTRTTYSLFGITTRWLVTFNISVFSVIFVIAHPVILCHPGRDRL